MSDRKTKIQNPNVAAELFFSPAETAPAETEAEEKVSIPASAQKKETGKIFRGYYITPELAKAIKLLSVERDIDASALVREMMTYYLENHN